MKRNSRYSFIIALALLVPSVGLATPSLAEPSALESKGFPRVFPIVEIVSMDVARGTVKVLTPKMFERKTTSGVEVSIDLASDQGEVVTLPLADHVTLRQVGEDEQGQYSEPITLEMLSVAIDQKQHISVDIGENDAGEMEVQQLSLFVGQPQKSLVQVLKEHFGVRSATQSRIRITITK